MTQALRERLERVDPTFVIICAAREKLPKPSAPQLIAFLCARGYAWAQVHPATMRRWLKQIDRLLGASGS